MRRAVRRSARHYEYTSGDTDEQPRSAHRLSVTRRTQQIQRPTTAGHAINKLATTSRQPEQPPYLKQHHDLPILPDRTWDAPPRPKLSGSNVYNTDHDIRLTRIQRWRLILRNLPPSYGRRGNRCPLFPAINSHPRQTPRRKSVHGVVICMCYTLSVYQWFRSLTHVFAIAKSCTPLPYSYLVHDFVLLLSSYEVVAM